MQVLTFNSHQPYLFTLASTLPWEFGIVTPRLPSGILKAWNPRIRPLPENTTLYTSVREAVEDRRWDWVLAHNIHDLLDVRDVKLPKVFLVHGTLSGRILQDRSRIDKAEYIKNLKMLLDANRCRIVYISELKRKDWGIPGKVLITGIDCGQYGGYRGDVRGVLQVCNHLQERGEMMGWQVYREVSRDLPGMVVGENPGLESSRIARDWEDLKEQYRAFRIYLYTPVFPYEDGYNMALMEAMATGMPVATLRHTTSPVRDGIGIAPGDSARSCATTSA